MTKDFADIDWTAAKAENARLRERERALIDELAEANAAHDDAETRVDAALLDLRIANEALATFNARVLGLEAELAEARRADWTTGICSKHQQPDPLCRICNPAIATARASALEEAARWHDAQAAELVIQFFPAHHRDALGGPVRAHDPEVFEEWAEHRRAATSIRALAKSPPSGRFVADEVMERVKAALRGLMGRLAMVAESPNRRQALDLGEAALAALNAEKQR